MKQQHRPREAKARQRVNFRMAVEDIEEAKRIVAATPFFTNVSHFYELAIRNMVDRYRLAPTKDEDTDGRAA